MTRKSTAYALVSLLTLGALILVWAERRRERVPSPSEIAALRAERQAIQDRFLALTESMPELSLREAPAAGLLIGIPTEFTRDLAQQVVSGLFGQLTLRLRNLKVSKADDVQARLLFGQRTIGQFVLDVSIAEVVTTLRPQRPKVTFTKNRLGVSLKVSLVEGRGKALVQLHWDSRGVANAICGDIEASRELHGTVAPADYAVEGSFAVAAEGGQVLLQPRFGDVVVKLRIRPSAEAWQVVDALVEQQGALCRAALRKVDVKQKLQEIVERGFSVKLPRRLFREIRLPAGVRQSLDLQGVAVTLNIKPVGVVVTKHRIWYGADVTTERSDGRD